jgi:hypothetical protein
LRVDQDCRTLRQKHAALEVKRAALKSYGIELKSQRSKSQWMFTVLLGICKAAASNVQQWKGPCEKAQVDALVVRKGPGEGDPRQRHGNVSGAQAISITKIAELRHHVICGKLLTHTRYILGRCYQTNYRVDTILSVGYLSDI